MMKSKSMISQRSQLHQLRSICGMRMEWMGMHGIMEDRRTISQAR